MTDAMAQGSSQDDEYMPQSPDYVGPPIARRGVGIRVQQADEFEPMPADYVGPPIVSRRARPLGQDDEFMPQPESYIGPATVKRRGVGNRFRSPQGHLED